MSLPTDLQLDDPVTRRPYGFRRVNKHDYVLCATFSTASERDDNSNFYGVDPYSTRRAWHHGARNTCLRFDVSDDPPEPQQVAR